MKCFAQLVWLAVAVTALTSRAVAQPAQKGYEAQGGIVTGRISVEGKPAPGLRVSLVPINSDDSASPPILKTISATDDEGRYRLTGVPAGTYTLAIAGGAYVIPDADRSKTVIVKEGEEVHDVDLTLERGGVVTGRVMDANGQPVIGERVTPQVLDRAGRKRSIILSNRSGQTDDRGFYRLYGLPAGRYVLSLALRRGTGVNGATGGYPTITYYPGVTDESQAATVEVKTGDEVENVDITLGRRGDSFSVKGRVVNAENGSPVPDIACGYADLTRRQPGVSSGCKTDASGEFRIEQVRPGSYLLFTVAAPDSDLYSEPATFEVTDGDVQGLEVKVRRGSSVSGAVVVEGMEDPAIMSRLTQLTVFATHADETLTSGSANAKIAPNGEFRLNGVKPGKVSFLITSSSKQDFSLLRVEQNGVEQARGIDITAGEAVTGVRLILAYAKGSVHGQIKTQGGALPGGLSIIVAIAPASAPTRFIHFAEPDPKGQFFIKDIPTGEYELTVRVTGPAVPGTRRRHLPPLKQPVTVKGGIDTEVNVVLDLAQMR